MRRLRLFERRSRPPCGHRAGAGEPVLTGRRLGAPVATGVAPLAPPVAAGSLWRHGSSAETVRVRDVRGGRVLVEALGPATRGAYGMPVEHLVAAWSVQGPG